MGIDEAIETNKALKLNIANENISKAIQLGIEALERERFMREYSGTTELLPSETEGRKDPTAGFTEEELADLRNAASDDIIG